MSQVWMVRAGEGAAYIEDIEKHNVVAIGWSALGDLRVYHSKDALSQQLKTLYPDWNNHRIAASAGQIFRFKQELIQDETVLSYNPGTRQYHVGRIIGDLDYRPDLIPELPNTRDVVWIKTINRDVLGPSTKNSLGAISTIFQISSDASQEIFGLLNDGSPTAVVPSAALVGEEALHDEERDVLKDTEERAFQFIQDRIVRLAWDEMQELVAAILRAMGYKTRISPPGPDRGKDIVASPDGLGFESPRILVEVKHRTEQMGSNEIRSFIGGLRSGDKGLYVSTGGFSKEARYEAERAKEPVMLMALNDLVYSIIEHYDEMDSKGKGLLPLTKIYWPV